MEKLDRASNRLYLGKGTAIEQALQVYKNTGQELAEKQLHEGCGCRNCVKVAEKTKEWFFEPISNAVINRGEDIAIGVSKLVYQKPG